MITKKLYKNCISFKQLHCFYSGDIDEEIEDSINELKQKINAAAKNLDTLSEDVNKKLTLISEKLNTLSGRTGTPDPLNMNSFSNTTTLSPRKLPVPRNTTRPRSLNV